MSNLNQSRERTNPFGPITVGKPESTVTTFDHEIDKFIIEYAEIERVEKTGEKDTDFIIHKDVREVSRVPRKEYIESYSDEVGILNILEKVRRSGDVSLLNQTHRVGVVGSERDALGRPVEDVGDFTAYQIDRIEALEAYKKGRSSFGDLPEDLKKNLSFEAMAKMTDDEVLAYLNKVRDAVIQKNEVKEGEK